MYADFTREGLDQYRSSQTKPSDFEQFWTNTLSEAAKFDLDVVTTRVESVIDSIEIYDLTFSGFNGERIKAWLRVPKHPAASVESNDSTDLLYPAVVEFLGYSHGRGFAEQNLEWASSGFVHLVMDSRGQGWHATPAATPDTGHNNPSPPGFMTRGIESRETYYYRRIYTDAVRAVAAVKSLPQVDPARVGVTGNSQGGGIALAAASLLGREVAGVSAQVPFLCDFPRAMRHTDSNPYAQFGEYLRSRRGEVEKVESVLRYFDNVNFAPGITAPTRITTSLMDAVCPPATIFGAFHLITAPKEIQVWEFNGHEGGQIEDLLASIKFLRSQLSIDSLEEYRS